MAGITSYEEYRRREYCKDVRCPVQLDLMREKEGSEQHARIRETCRTACRHTTHEFHRWLTDQGYLIVRPSVRPDAEAPRKVKA